MKFPKKKRIKATPKEWKELRRQVFEREKGICQICGQYAPLHDMDGNYDPFTCGDACHIKSRGAGGDDVLDNLRWVHHTGHMKEHAGEI